MADDWQKHGIGRKLMGALIECARMKGYRAVVGDVLALNTKMFRLMTSLGFTIHPHPDDTAVKRVVKPLQGRAARPKGTRRKAERHVGRPAGLVRVNKTARRIALPFFILNRRSGSEIEVHVGDRTCSLPSTARKRACVSWSSCLSHQIARPTR